MVVDACNMFDNFNYGVDYHKNGFDKVIELLNERNDKVNRVLEENEGNIRSLDSEPDMLCIILGFDKFYTKLSDENKQKFFYAISTYENSTLRLLMPVNFNPYEKTNYKTIHKYILLF